jgi:hypothetical protein
MMGSSSYLQATLHSPVKKNLSMQHSGASFGKTRAFSTVAGTTMRDTSNLQMTKY